MGKIPLPLPPLPEQHRIVAKIEELFSELDNGIANLEKAKAQLKVYRQAVLKSAFEGKLTEQWRSEQMGATEGSPVPNNHEVGTGTLPSAEDLLTRIQEERQNHYEQQVTEWREAVAEWEANASSAEAGRRRGKEGRPPSPPGSGGRRKPSKPKKPKEYPPLTEKELEELPELPVGWQWYYIGQILLSISDGPFGSNLKTKDYQESGVRVIRLENIGFLEFDESKETYVSEQKYEKLRRYSLLPGDLIFSSFISEEIRACILPDLKGNAINKADCFRVRTDVEIVNNRYLMYILSSRQSYNRLIIQTHGATRPRVNTTQLKGIPVPICSTSEQHQIVQEIESRLSVCDHLEQEIETALQKSEALRQSILKKAFEGRLVPQDPDDEPAAELLKRIKVKK